MERGTLMLIKTDCATVILLRLTLFKSSFFDLILMVYLMKILSGPTYVLMLWKKQRTKISHFLTMMISAFGTWLRLLPYVLFLGLIRKRGFFSYLYKSYWHKHFSLKIPLFIWKLIHSAQPTDLVVKKGIYLPSKCLCCSSHYNIEFNNHFFFIFWNCIKRLEFFYWINVVWRQCSYYYSYALSLVATC